MRPARLSGIPLTQWHCYEHMFVTVKFASSPGHCLTASRGKGVADRAGSLRPSAFVAFRCSGSFRLRSSVGRPLAAELASTAGGAGGKHDREEERETEGHVVRGRGWGSVVEAIGHRRQEHEACETDCGASGE